jgi:hypothetical protein
MDRKWLMYRSQLSFSATIVNPEACCKSNPVGETRLPVARKLDIFEPMSKLVFWITLCMYLSERIVSQNLVQR